MIGVDRFASVFGGAPAHTAQHLAEHIRAVIRAGYSPVLCKPGTKEPGCILSSRQAKRAGEHPCGHRHVLDDPARAGAIVARFTATHGGMSLGLHLARSSMAVIRTAAAPGMTVAAPRGLGHWWFELPSEAAPSSHHPGWSFLSGDRYVLVPPTTDQHLLVGGTLPADTWMLR